MSKKFDNYLALFGDKDDKRTRLFIHMMHKCADQNRKKDGREGFPYQSDDVRFVQDVVDGATLPKKHLRAVNFSDEAKDLLVSSNAFVSSEWIKYLFEVTTRLQSMGPSGASTISKANPERNQKVADFFAALAMMKNSHNNAAGDRLDQLVWLLLSKFVASAKVAGGAMAPLTDSSQADQIDEVKFNDTQDVLKGAIAGGAFAGLAAGLVVYSVGNRLQAATNNVADDAAASALSDKLTNAHLVAKYMLACADSSSDSKQDADAYANMLLSSNPTLAVPSQLNLGRTNFSKHSRNTLLRRMIQSSNGELDLKHIKENKALIQNTILALKALMGNKAPLADAEEAKDDKNIGLLLDAIERSANANYNSLPVTPFDSVIFDESDISTDSTDAAIEFAKHVLSATNIFKAQFDKHPIAFLLTGTAGANLTLTNPAASVALKADLGTIHNVNDLATVKKEMRRLSNHMWLILVVDETIKLLSRPEQNFNYNLDKFVKALIAEADEDEPVSQGALSSVFSSVPSARGPSSRNEVYVRADGTLYELLPNGQRRDVGMNSDLYKNLKVADKCLGTGVKENGNLKCSDFLMNCLAGKNINSCKNFLLSPDFFENANREVDAMLPRTAVDLLRALGFQGKMANKNGQNIVEPEDLSSWHNNLASKLNPGEADQIKRNSNLNNYLSMVLGKVVSNPAILNKNWRSTATLQTQGAATQPGSLLQRFGFAFIPKLVRGGADVSSDLDRISALVGGSMNAKGVSNVQQLHNDVESSLLLSNQLESEYKLALSKLENTGKTLPQNEKEQIEKLLSGLKDNEVKLKKINRVIKVYNDVVTKLFDPSPNTIVNVDHLEDMINKRELRKGKVVKKQQNVINVLQSLNESVQKLDNRLAGVENVQPAQGQQARQPSVGIPLRYSN